MNLGSLPPATSAVLEDRVEAELEVGKVVWVGRGGVPAWAFLAATAARNGDRRTPELLNEELCGKASLGLLLMDSAGCCCRGIDADDDIAPKGDEEEGGKGAEAVALCADAGEDADAAAMADE